MEKIEVIIIFVLSLILLAPLSGSANRGMINIGPEEVIIRESAQNAIIAWNGCEEIIVLSTDVLSSEPTLVLEVFPLPSNPEKVEEANFDSFRKLGAIINEHIKVIREKVLTGGRGADDGVEIKFHKQIGAHDVTIVKVDDAGSFLKWVKEFAKGKKLSFSGISSEFKNAVSNYLDKDIRFFVFDIIETSKASESIRPLVYRFKTDFLYYPFEITATSDAGESDSNINLFLITKGIIDQDIVRLSGLWPRAGFDKKIILTRQELREINPALDELFKSDAFAMCVWYHGSLKRLNRDLLVRDVFSDNDLIKTAREYFRKGLNSKDLSSMEYYFIEALKLWPGYAGAHNNLGDVYEKQGRYQDAIKQYEIASALAANISIPYFGLGDVYFKLGSFQQASIYYEKGLKLDPDDQASIQRLRLSRILTSTILFKFDSDKLTDKAIKQLKLIAEALSSPEFRDTLFEIQGHTDSTGPGAYNLYLSQRRAEKIRTYLIEKGLVATAKLIVAGYGEDRPIASNATKKGRLQNRRVEIKNLLNRRSISLDCMGQPSHR